MPSSRDEKGDEGGVGDASTLVDNASNKPPTSSAPPLLAELVRTTSLLNATNRKASLTSLSSAERRRRLRHYSRTSLGTRAPHHTSSSSDVSAVSSSPSSYPLLSEDSKRGTGTSVAQPSGDSVDPDLHLVHPVLRSMSASLTEPDQRWPMTMCEVTDDAKAKVWTLTENRHDEWKKIANVDQSGMVMTPHPRSHMNTTSNAIIAAQERTGTTTRKPSPAVLHDPYYTTSVTITDKTSPWLEDPRVRANMTGHIVLACSALLCNPLCGLLALLFAANALWLALAGKCRKASKFGCVSICLSVTGIFIAAINFAQL